MRSLLSECRDAMQIIFLLAGTLLVLCACINYICAIRIKLGELRELQAERMAAASEDLFLSDQGIKRQLNGAAREADRQMRQADRKISDIMQSYFDELRAGAQEW